MKLGEVLEQNQNGYFERGNVLGNANDILSVFTLGDLQDEVIQEDGLLLDAITRRELCLFFSVEEMEQDPDEYYFTCPSCEDRFLWVNREHDEVRMNDSQTLPTQTANMMDDQEVCYFCWETDQKQQLVRFEAEEFSLDPDNPDVAKTSVVFGRISAEQYFSDSVDDPEQWFFDLLDKEQRSVEFLEVDDVPLQRDARLNLVCLASGSFSTFLGEPEDDSPAWNFLRRLSKGDCFAPPVPFYVLGQGAGSFHTYADLLCAEQDIPVILEWLGLFDLDLRALRSMFR